jgi:hypothetical protein
MTEFYANEAWCPSCAVSHPPGTKRCLHCGGAVMPLRPVVGMRSATTTAPPGPIEMATAPATAEAAAGEAAERATAARPMRIGIATIWIVLALVGSLLRACSERG